MFYTELDGMKERRNGGDKDITLRFIEHVEISITK